MIKTICNKIISMVLVFAIVSQLCVMQISAHSHEGDSSQHNWTYVAEGNTITASCCEAEEASAQVTLSLAEGEVETGRDYVPFDAAQ